MTIARLELQGVVLGSRLSEVLEEELQGSLEIEKIYVWSDSTISLSWIDSESGKFATFVANRVAEIQTNLSKSGRVPVELRHCPGIDNPADMVSRGLTAEEFEKNLKFWQEGPPWLRESEDRWPARQVVLLDISDPLFSSELKKSERESVALPASSSRKVQTVTDYFSSWNKVERSAALAARFLRALAPERFRKAGAERKWSAELPRSASVWGKLAGKRVAIEVTTRDKTVGKVILLLEMQKAAFGSEIGQMEKDGLKQKFFQSGPLKGLEVVRDSVGLLRVVGRLQEVGLPEQVTHPVLVAGKSKLASLLIQSAHERINHMGADWTKAELRRQGFYLVPGSNPIRKVVYNCVFCQVRNPKPVEVPWAPFHSNRFSEEGERPFASVGLDHFGSFPVYPTRRSRVKEKRWGVMFFCLVSRAVHLEVVERADVESFLLAYNRFVSVRGFPGDVYCDLGRTNVAASDELGRVLQESREQIGAELFKTDTTFHFNPLATPHFGGNYERAIRTTRKCLVAALSGVTKLTGEVFATALAQVADIVNRRPIATDDQGLALTPADVLRPYGACRPFPPGASTYHQFKKVKQVVDSFWKRWRALYLTQLSARNKRPRGGDVSKLRVNDVVLIRRSSPGNVFTGSWELARVVSMSVNEHDRHARLITVKVRPRDASPGELEEVEVALGNVSLLEAVNYV
jgi:hypothetical protein